MRPALLASGLSVMALACSQITDFRDYEVRALDGGSSGDGDGGAGSTDASDADACAPAEEVCNRLDDDCDGDVDDIAASGCTTGLLGVCAAGEAACQGETQVCNAIEQASPEICDGLDNDCDGDIDEPSGQCYPDGAAGCEFQSGAFVCTGACRAGSRVCDDGSDGACEGAVLPTNTDGCTVDGPAVDDDCDGAIDEDCSCEDGAVQACYDGPLQAAGVGACALGQQTCQAGTFGPCEGGGVLPQPERCDNLGADDDCNGTEDDVQDAAAPCSDEAAAGICRSGVLACLDGVLACVTPDSRDEACNQLDDDCDGSADEDFDLQTDPEHCGACGAACGEGQSCCDGACVNTETSTDHCGACGTACGEHEVCCASGCVDVSSSADHCGGCGKACDADSTCCGGTCADTRSNSENCGGCSDACVGDDLCCASECAVTDSPLCQGCAESCAPGTTCCQGSCVDFMSSPAHCGGCGAQFACTEGQLCCGGSCVDAGPANCGRCGEACAERQLCCDSGCVDRGVNNCSACGDECGGGAVCCESGCADLLVDLDNCGGCGTRCNTDELCSDGVCCAKGELNCGGACVDPQEDRRNCGTCGNDCTALIGLLGTCNDGTCN